MSKHRGKSATPDLPPPDPQVPLPPQAKTERLARDLELHRIELDLQSHELRQAQQRLVASSERYWTLFELSPVGYMTLDQTGTIQELNLAMAQLLGAGKDRLAGKPALLYIVAADRLRLHRFIQGCIQTGSAPPIELAIAPGRHRPDRTVELHGQAIPSAWGDQRWCQVAVFDVTARKQAETQQRQAKDELEQRVAARTYDLECARRTTEARTRALQQAHHALKALTLHLQQAKEAESARIAREIHDELGASLTAIKYSLLTSKRRTDPDARHILERNPALAHLVDGAIESLRRIITDLRPSVLDELGLYGALEWLCQEFQERNGIACRFKKYGPEMRLESQQATAIFRIAQEALTNAARHAQAHHIDILVTADQHLGQLQVRDDGCGIPDPQRARKNGFGLLGMQERARIINGSVEITAAPGAGTTVAVQFPLPGATNSRQDGRGA